MTNIAITLGKNLKRMRIARRLSQGDLSRRVGMDRAYISGLENGKRNPTIGNVQKLARALDVSVSDLLR